MGELMKFSAGGVPANLEELQKNVVGMRRGLPASTRMPILKLQKSGIYEYGQDDTQIQEGSQWALNPASFEKGWAAWVDSELVDEVMVPMGADYPPRDALADYGTDKNGNDYRKKQIAVQLQCLNGEDIGVCVQWRGTSLGLAGAADMILGKIAEQLSGADKAYCCPVLELLSRFYKHPKHGQVAAPVPEIVDWVTFEGERLSAGKGKAAKTQKALKPPVLDSDDDVEPESEPEKPKRRRAAASDAADKPAPRKRRAAVDTAPTLLPDEETEQEEPEADDAPAPRRRRRAV